MTPDDRIDRWRRGELTPEEERAFRARVANEPELAAEIDGTRHIDRALQRELAPPVDLRERLLARVPELAEALEPEQRRRPAASRAGAWAAAFLAAAAAVLLLLRLRDVAGDPAVPDSPVGPTATSRDGPLSSAVAVAALSLIHI